MVVNGKIVKLITKGDSVILVIDGESVTLTKGEWSKLISAPSSI